MRRSTRLNTRSTFSLLLLLSLVLLFSPSCKKDGTEAAKTDVAATKPTPVTVAKTPVVEPKEVIEISMLTTNNGHGEIDPCG